MKNRQIKNQYNISHEITAVLLLALGLFLSLSIFSFSPRDPGLNSAADASNIHNWAGIVGSYCSDIFITTFGVIAFLAPILVLLLAFLQFANKQLNLRWRSAIGCLILLVSASAIIHLRFPFIEIGMKAFPGGGILGGISGELLLRYLNRPGAYLAASTIVLISFSLVSGISPIALFVILGALLGNFLMFLKHAVPRIVSFLWYQTSKGVALTTEYLKLAFKKEKEIPETFGDPIKPEPVVKPKPKFSQPVIVKNEPALKSSQSDEQLSFRPISSGHYNLPPVSLLDNPPEKHVLPSNEILQKNSLIVQKKLSDFGVEGNVTAIHPGPVITMYEFEPSAGTKVSTIANLEDDLSLTLGGKNVRIIPHLPGKAAVGIEVPNSQRDVVSLKEMLSSKDFQKNVSKLPLPLGVTTEGNPFISDLIKMPHILVAGATGSGKSVMINCLITSLLYKLSPDQLKFILIDPKMLELTAYQGIPHLLLPVVTKPKLAVKALRWTTKEMEKRYRLMADAGTRNLSAYNLAITSGKIQVKSQEEANELFLENPEAVVHTGQLPYLVIVVDEMADLMMTASQDMEDLVIRLAQLARAAGIHMILATQRPSVDVVTGLIKANFPARISFKVTSRHDSRTILDTSGAETLLGSGDMLFLTPSGNNLMRLHGAYISEGEVSRVVNYLQEQGEPKYDETILQSQEESENTELEVEEIDDDLYDKAVEIVSQTKQASISLIQRRLRIGYNRAARLIEKMETKGVVGPADGSKPREVLLNSLQ